MKRKYNLLVIGAGTAGCVAAKTGAEKGLSVCLLDKKDKEYIGNKICGDAVGKHHFERLGIKPPKGEELSRIVKGIEVYSPDLESKFSIENKNLHGYMINRLAFGQRLLKETLDIGVNFKDKTRVLKPILKGNKVEGVVAKESNKSKSKFFGDVTIDASGYLPAIREEIPESELAEFISNEDVEVCYREIRGLKYQLNNPEYTKMYLSQDKAPGGYYWMFPKEENKVNVGIGVQMTDNHPNPKKQFYNEVLSKSIFEESKIIKKGGGLVPTRKPLDTLVGDRILIAGDAGWMVNPIHGGGIGPSMMGGKLAAETAFEAIKNEDMSKKGLWKYNIKYMKSYGAKQAGLDVFRIFLQNLSDNEINYGMKHRLIKEEDLLSTSMDGDLKLNITDKAIRSLKGLFKPSLLLKLREVSEEMRKYKRRYLEYPELENYETWQREQNEHYNKIKESLGK